MTEAFHLLFAWTLLALLLSWLASALYPLLRKGLDLLSAGTASSAVLSFSLLPAITAFITLVLLSNPHWVEHLIPQHCHGELCGPHNPEITLETLLGMSSVATVLLLLSGFIGLLITSVLSIRLRMRNLDQLSEAGTPGVRLIKTQRVMAWCVGLWRPQVYVSSGLLEKLDEQEASLVLAHEQAHARRRDNLRKSVLYWLTAMWPPPLKRAIRSDFSQLNEQACDIEALSFQRNHQGQGKRRAQSTYASIGQESSSQLLMLCSMAAAVWLPLILVSIYYGHSLIEWMAQ